MFAKVVQACNSNTFQTEMNFVFPDGSDSEDSTPPGSPQVERAGAAADDANAAENKKRRTSLANLYRGPGGVELSKDVLNNITMFKRKQKKVDIIVFY